MSCKGTETFVDSDYPWPFPYCSLAAIDPLGYFGFDVYHLTWGFTGLLDPRPISNDPAAPTAFRAFPLMGDNWPSWISPYEYCELLPMYGIPCTLTWPSAASGEIDMDVQVTQDPISLADPQALHALATADEYLVAMGLVDTKAISATLTEVFTLDELFPDALQQASEQLGYTQPMHSYTIVQLDAEDQELASQSIFFNDSESTNLWSFFEVVPLEAETQKIQVQHSLVPLTEKSASPNPPDVTLLTPKATVEAVKAEEHLISWSATDLDNDPLTFDLLYSPDDGVTWMAMALGLTGSSYTMSDQNRIPGSDQARIRVIANDGFHSVYDNSDASFSLAKAAPKAVIMSPGADSTGLPLDLKLKGLGTDAEDGAMDSDDLSWTSDVDGFLGTGTELWTQDLSLGWHTITLTVTDSDGQQGSANIQVRIGHGIYLPLVAQPGSGRQERP